MRKRTWGAGVAALTLVVAACGSDDDGGSGSATTAASGGDTTVVPPPLEPSTTAGGTDTTAGGTDTTAGGSDTTGGGGECESLEPVRLQLQWFKQAQFAGYIAAQDQGFYEARCMEVEILEGGVDIVPQQVLADGQADFAIAWVPKALQTREQGAEITQIAQVFQRSGTLQVSFKDTGIESVADFADKTIGNWGFGNEYEIFAALGQAELDPATDVELVQQQFDMVGLLAGDIDAAEAMIYNEYAQVLEAENPDTGELYTADDLNVISYEEEGVGMLQDAIWADSTRMEDEAYSDLGTRFLAASMEGWAYCRDNPEECRDMVVAAGSQLGNSHQLWQMNEINKLVWPSPDGVGILDEAAWERTVEIAQNTPNLEGATVLTELPGEGAYNMEWMTSALELLGDLDTTGEDFEPIEVTLEPGGE